MDVILDAISVAKEHWIVISVLFVTILIYWHYIVNFTSLKQLGIPGPTPFPLIGNAGVFIWRAKDLHTYFSTALKKYGKVFGLYYLKEAAVVVGDPDIAKQILVKEFDKFHDRPNGGMEFPEPLASMMTEVKGQRWKDIRSIMTPAFTSGKLKGMMYIMHEAADTLLKKIEKAVKEKQAVDIHKWHQSVTMEVILSAAYGIKCESQTNPDDKVTKYAREGMDPKPWPEVFMMIPFIGKMLSKAIVLSSWGFNWHPLINIARKIINQRRSEEGTKRNDMLQIMLDSQHPDRKGHKLSEDELIAEMVLFILAGYDTSSNILGLTCYHMAIYPEIQEKVYQEIKRVCQSEDTIMYDEIKELHYLDACISETLRLYPPGFLTARTVDENCVINGVTFKKGMAVFIPVYSMQRDEDYWSEPEKFNPERFLPENKESLNQFAFLPFGSGPRNCIGMRFAQMEMKTVLVRMLQKFRLKRGPETSVPLKIEPRAVLAPGEPVMVRFEKRE